MPSEPGANRNECSPTLFFPRNTSKRIFLLLFVSEIGSEATSVATARPNQKNKITKTKIMAKALRISVMVYLTLISIKLGRTKSLSKCVSFLLFLKSCNDGSTS